MTRRALGLLFLVLAVPAQAWTNFPLRYTLDTNIVSWAEMESTLGVSSQLWYAARERNVAGNENQDGGHSWNETHPYLYEIATSNVTYTDNLTYTNTYTNTYLVYSNSVKRYDIDGYPIGDNELGSYEITNAVWTNSLWINPPVKYSEMAAGVFSVWNDVNTSDDAPYEFYVEWLLSTNGALTLNQYFARSGITDTNGTVAYPGIPYQTRQGAWARHTLGYRTNSIVTTNAWGLITDNGTSDAWGSGVSVIPMPLELAEARWIPDLYLDGYPSFGGSYEGAYVWSEDDQGWNRDSAFFRIVGFYTNGVWKYVGLETGAGAHVFVGNQLGISNAWTATDAYTNIAGNTASMIVSHSNDGIWQFREIQPLFDQLAGFLRPYTGTPEVVFSSTTNREAVVTIQGTILTNWNNNPFNLDTNAEETATATGGTNRYKITEEDTWLSITNIDVDINGFWGDSISVTYYSPTTYYLWTTPNYNGRKGSTDQLDEMFRSLNALQWTALNLNGKLGITSSVPANVGQWTWDGYGWADAEENVETNATDPAGANGIGALVVTSPDPHWAIVDTPTDLDINNDFFIRFTADTNDYRSAWGFQFRAEIAGTITLSNSHATTAQDASWQVNFGSVSNTGGGSIGAGAAVVYSFGTLTNVFTGTSYNTNTLFGCGAIGYTVSGTNIVYHDSAITYTLAEFRFARLWARRWSASVIPDLALNEAQQLDFTNLLADVTTEREMYLESATPLSPFPYTTNFVYAPEVDDLRYDSTNMVGQFTLMGSWTESTPSPTNIYADGEIGENIPYGSGVVWSKGWAIKFESSPDVIKGLYLIKWDTAGGFRHGAVTNIYDWPQQAAP